MKMKTKLQGLCPSIRPVQALAASVFLLAAVLLASCTAEADKTDRTSTGGADSANKREVLLSFKNKLAVKTTKAETKADAPIATKEENEISTLDIYVFASADETGTYTYSERFAYRPEGIALPAGANKLNLAVGADNATTTALLELQKGMFVRLYCLANQTELVNPAGDNVEDAYFQPLEYTMETGNLVEGTPSETDFQKLHSPLLAEAGTALNLPLPMVGSQTVPIDLTDFGSSARVQTGFKLTRTMARFDVSNIETDSKFHLESISMGNGRKGVSFFPIKVVGASPAADGDLITYPTCAFEGDKANTGLQVSAFYCYPCLLEDEGYLVLKGTYQANLTETTDVTYKVDFKQPTADGGIVALEINNNHRYTIGITKADEYKLDFTLDVEEWDEGSDIDGFDPTAGSGDFAFDPDGIADAATTYDADTKMVTMLLAADSKFSLSTTATSTMSHTLRYAKKNYDWLEIKEEPVTKAASSTLSGTEHKFIISMKAGYTGGVYPRGIIRFIDDATGKGNTLIVDALSFVPELALSASDGTSSFADNKLTLKAVSSVEIPSVTLSVNCKGGSKLADFPEWMTVDKTESDLDTDTYKFEVKIDKAGFPTANPSEVTFKFHHKLDGLKEIPVILSIVDEPTFGNPTCTIGDFESKTFESRNALRVGTEGGTVTLNVTSLFEPSVATSGYAAFGGDLSWFTPEVQAPSISSNRRVYALKVVVPKTSGDDELYQANKAALKIQSGNTTIKEYDLYRSANVVTYPVSDTKRYTAVQMKGTGSTTYWAPVNVGAIEIPTTVPSASSTAGGTNDITAGCGLLFQWGRKYGFTNTNNSDVTNAETFDGKTDPLGFPTGKGVLADMSPWDKSFIVNSSSSPHTQYNWLRFEAGADNPSGSAMPDNAWYQKLWNLDEVASTIVDATKTASKTPSDPCPEGWRVPTMAEWAAIGAGNNSIIKKWDSTTHLMEVPSEKGPKLILPAAGHRNEDDGLSYEQGYHGIYWSSSVPSGRVSARYVGFYDATLTKSTCFRATGLSVRCLQE